MASEAELAVQARRERALRDAALGIRLQGRRAPRRARLPRQVYPGRLEAEYARQLVAMLRELRAAAAPLLGELPALLASAKRERERVDAGEGRRLRQLTDQMAAAMHGAVAPERVEALAREFARKTQTYQRVQLGRQVRAALGADVFIADRRLNSLVDGFVQHNVSLIRRIPQRVHARVESVVQRAVTSGQLTADITDELSSTFGIEERHARVIARDQAGKLYGDVNRSRQEELGVTRYIWRTVNDSRVRGLDPKDQADHASLEGKTFSWDDPPHTGGNSPDGRAHPGEDIQCRCYAEPVIDDVLAALPDPADEG